MNYFIQFHGFNSLSICSVEIAMSYYKRAVELGWLESMYNLALMYTQARGTEQDFKQAIPLLEAAALQDHSPSVYMMGIIRMQVFLVLTRS